MPIDKFIATSRTVSAGKKPKPEHLNARKSCGCGCGDGDAETAIKPRKSVRDDAISHKSLWTESISIKASRRDAQSEFDDITEDEREISRKVDRVLQAQIRSVLKQLNASEAPSAELTAKVEQILKSSKWDSAIADALRPYLQRSIAQGISVGGDTVRKLADLGPDWTPATTELDRYAESESVRLATGAARSINRYTAVRVADIMGTAIGDGLTVDEIAGKVRDWAGKAGDPERQTRSRSVMIARTEAQRASRAAEVEAWRQTGLVKGKTWLLAPDPCEFCEAAAAQYSSNPVPLDGAFFRKGSTLEGADGNAMTLDYEDVQGPPLHPNCRCSMQPVIDPMFSEIEADIERQLKEALEQGGEA